MAWEAELLSALPLGLPSVWLLESLLALLLASLLVSPLA